MKLPVRKFCCAALLLEGVDCVFGYPGGAVLYIYDAMHGNPDFNHLLTRHEQGAIHAADGYARSTGKVGVCIATSGPGATNLVTGIATAYMDSVPLVVIPATSRRRRSVPMRSRRRTLPASRCRLRNTAIFVRDVEDLPRIIHEAFHIASTGRKGPVLIDIPKDVSAQKTMFRYAENDRIARLQSDGESEQAAGRQAGQGDRRSEAAGDHGRRRRRLLPALTRTARIRGRRRGSRSRRRCSDSAVFRAGMSCGWACRACTALIRRTKRCKIATC